MHASSSFSRSRYLPQQSYIMQMFLIKKFEDEKNMAIPGVLSLLRLP